MFCCNHAELHNNAIADKMIATKPRPFTRQPRRFSSVFCHGSTYLHLFTIPPLHSNGLGSTLPTMRSPRQACIKAPASSPIPPASSNSQQNVDSTAAIWKTNGTVSGLQCTHTLSSQHCNFSRPCDIPNEMTCPTHSKYSIAVLIRYTEALKDAWIVKA